MTDLDKACEWANRGGHLVGVIHPDAEAAIEIIQSLPDRWISAEKVQEIIEEMDLCLEAKSTTDFSKGIDNATTTWRDALKALIAPKLPTLADMTPEERKACQWMQARYSGSDCDHVIVLIWPERAVLLRKDDGLTFDDDLTEITPLPDLPKLQWPGTEVVEPPALPEGMRLADHEEYGRVVTSPWGDGVDDYKIFFLNEDVRAGADYEYAHESTLTFLDGEA